MTSERQDYAMFFRWSGCKRLFVFLCVLVLWPLPVWACAIPVFRYAMERWLADDYEVMVFHRGPLAPEHKAVVDWLRKRASDNESARANLKIRAIDLSATPDGEMLGIWQGQSSAALPWMVVRFPRVLQIDQDVWAGALSMSAAEALVDSPARRNLARRLLDGDAAVWLLLESGDREKDAEAEAWLKAAITEAEQTIELPQAVDVFADESEAENTPDIVPQHPSLSLLRVSRSDPAERIFINMLAPGGPGGKALSEPVALPVFGRGRVLMALVGNEINKEGVKGASSFISGPCSCQVKDLNPGADLLVAADWEASLTGSLAEDAELPSLAGMTDFVSTAADEGASSAAEADVEGRGGTLLRNILLASLAGLVFLAGATYVLKLRKR